MAAILDQRFDDDFDSVEEKDLTQDQKVMLLWRSIMGFGYGAKRIPGLLEQMASTQKKHDFYWKIAFAGGGVIAVISQHANIADILKLILAFFGH